MSGLPSAPRPLLVGLRLAGAPVLVVGGGAVATRRARRLAEAGAHITVVAPEIAEELTVLADVCRHRPYEARDVDGMVLVVAATGEAEVDALVVADARAAGAWANHTGDASLGDLIVPAVAAGGEVSIAVTTGGQSPSLARRLAAELQHDLVPVAAEAAELMGALRTELRGAGQPTAHPGWETAIEAGLLDLVRRGDRQGAQALLRHHLGLAGPS